MKYHAWQIPCVKIIGRSMHRRMPAQKELHGQRLRARVGSPVNLGNLHFSKIPCVFALIKPTSLSFRGLISAIACWGRSTSPGALP